MDKIAEIRHADPDSHYRLKTCSCGRAPVYARVLVGTGDGWTVICPGCGKRTREPRECRHNAQRDWNQRKCHADETAEGEIK